MKCKNCKEEFSEDSEHCFCDCGKCFDSLRDWEQHLDYCEEQYGNEEVSE